MKKDEELADKIIKEMETAGLSPDEILEVIELARKKYNSLKEADYQKKLKLNGWIDTNDVGHLVYQKGSIAYAECCENLTTKDGTVHYSKEQFEKKFLTKIN